MHTFIMCICFMVDGKKDGGLILTPYATPTPSYAPTMNAPSLFANSGNSASLGSGHAAGLNGGRDVGG